MFFQACSSSTGVIWGILNQFFQAWPKGLWKLRAAYEPSKVSVEHSDVCWDKLSLIGEWLSFPLSSFSWEHSRCLHAPHALLKKKKHQSVSLVKTQLKGLESWNFPTLLHEAHQFMSHQDTCCLTSDVALSRHSCPIQGLLEGLRAVLQHANLPQGSTFPGLYHPPSQTRLSCALRVCTGERQLPSLSQKLLIHTLTSGPYSQGRDQLVSLEFGEY